MRKRLREIGERPQLMPENEEAWDAFQLSQPRLAPDGSVVGVDIPSLVAVMDVLEVADRRDCLEKVQYVWDLLKRSAPATAPAEPATPEALNSRFGAR